MSTNGKMPNANQRARAAEREAAKETAAAENTLAQVIGQSVAIHLAQLLGQLLPQMMWQPACVLCVNVHKQAEQAHQVAVANAQAAAEEPPEAQMPQIQPSLTWMPIQPAPGQPSVVVPVCYGHFAAAQTGRTVGLVDAAGNALVTSAG